MFYLGEFVGEEKGGGNEAIDLMNTGKMNAILNQCRDWRLEFG